MRTKTNFSFKVQVKSSSIKTSEVLSLREIFISYIYRCFLSASLYQPTCSSLPKYCCLHADSSLSKMIFFFLLPPRYKPGTEVSWVKSTDLINCSESWGPPHWSSSWQPVGVGSFLQNTDSVLNLSPSLLPCARITIVGAQICGENWRPLTHSEQDEVSLFLSILFNFIPLHQPLFCYHS